MERNSEIIRSEQSDAECLHVKHESGLDIYIMEMEGYHSSFALFGTKYGSINTRFRVKGEERTGPLSVLVDATLFRCQQIADAVGVYDLHIDGQNGTRMEGIIQVDISDKLRQIRPRRFRIGDPVNLLPIPIRNHR